MKILFSKRCLDYRQPGHPESPDRVLKTFEFLKQKGFEFVEPLTCSEKELLLAHDKKFVEEIKSEKFSYIDSPALPGIYDYARLSAGSAINAMEISLKNEKAFSLMRPPGHHSGKNGLALGSMSLGFCYFNNIAIACKKALNYVKKIAIIDFDCHHGNGTQDIFIGCPNVLYVSLHKHPFYPGTGWKSEKNCLNYPLSSEITKEEYLETFKKALDEVKKFRPNLIAVSAGFDAHKDDDITFNGLNLDYKSFRIIGELIKELKKPSFAVLEGGYGETLHNSVYEFIVGYSD
jgi:acetoin utilization deacetylase AcuC-like enzyme